MAYRIENYKDAFEGVLGIKIDDKIQRLIKDLEKDGHTEKSISYSIWKTQDKICAFKGDTRFMSILRNEIKKYSWGKNDPRWKEYWKKKNEQKKAAELREKLQRQEKEKQETYKDEYEYRNMSMRAKGLRNAKKPTGYVYFIQGLCGGAIKIGYSKDPESRLKGLQTGYPDTLTILMLIPGTIETEKTIHREFEASKLNGEWFRPDEYLIDRLAELKEKYSIEEQNV